MSFRNTKIGGLPIFIVNFAKIPNQVFRSRLDFMNNFISLEQSTNLDKRLL